MLPKCGELLSPHYNILLAVKWKHLTIAIILFYVEKISNKRPSNMSQSPSQQVSGQRTQCVTYRTCRLLQCVNVPVRADPSSACSCSSASPNLRSSTQSCVQLYISNPVITGFSAPGKTIIGTSCLFVLSFPLPVLTMTKLTFAKASLDLKWSLCF